jgi:hypothetical protein
MCIAQFPEPSTKWWSLVFIKQTFSMNPRIQHLHFGIEAIAIKLSITIDSFDHAITHQKRYLFNLSLSCISTKASIPFSIAIKEA